MSYHFHRGGLNYQTTLDGLDAGASYEIRVRAQNLSTVNNGFSAYATLAAPVATFASETARSFTYAGVDPFRFSSRITAGGVAQIDDARIRLINENGNQRRSHLV